MIHLPSTPATSRGRIAILWTSLVAASCLVSMSGLVHSAPLTDSQLEAYHATMSHVVVPHRGCFKAVYPNTAWQQDVCVNAPQHPYVPGADGTSGPRPAIVGNTVDYIAQVKSGHISSATGSFKSVTGVTSESDSGTNNRF